MTSIDPDSRDELRVDDPRAMRALSHPTRLAIIDFLYTRDSATATECAAAINESPASCSFHLRTLARWGFIEALTARGRERPWRTIVWSGTDPDSAARSLVADSVVREFMRRDQQTVESYLRRQQELSDEWREAVQFRMHLLQISLPDLLTLKRQFAELIEPYLSKGNGKTRPDTRPIHLVIRTVPEMDETSWKHGTSK